uniref:C-type lectin domain-containing protein n=1 Tax=Plectus sambesii TaxID=2011161 RepID=A0A914XLE3_9BILA
MELQIALFLFLSTHAASSASIPTCPNGWMTGEFLPKCYKFFTQRMLWRDADQLCQQQGPGGHLVSIHNRFENNAVIDFATDTPGSNSSEAWWWIGFNNFNNKFAWIDDSPSDFTNWALGEPSNTQVENCACMSDITSDCPSCWHMRGCGTCNNQRHFMCERNALPQDNAEQP